MKIEIAEYSRLTKLSNNRNAVRTKSMLGFARLPRTGDRLVIVGRGLEYPNRIRIITTSVVQRILKTGAYTVIIQTENSTYQLDRLGLGEEGSTLAEFIVRVSKSN